jgi:1,4-alpha-glucan branching enzyme
VSPSGVVFVLHAHLPYVRHLDRPDRLEEGWLFEAVAESYLPLLQQLEQWEAGGQAVKLTLSLSPPLLAMLADPILQERCHAYLRRLVVSAERELVRTAEDPVFHALSQHYHRRFVGLLDWYEEHQGDVLGQFARHAEAGRLELWTSSATHAFLPFIGSDWAISAQVQAGIAAFSEVFGYRPKGFWLPECGYRPGLERWLGAEGVAYTVLNPRPSDLPDSGVWRPFRLGAGVLGLPRAQELSMRVWDAHGGYPGSPWYRDFYRDIGFDLDDQAVAPYLYPAGVRRATGFKYWRVTGSDVPKEPYEPGAAMEEVARHARHFADEVEQALGQARQSGIAEPVLTLPFDAELFGHWWAEGVDWLGAVLPQLPLAYASDLGSSPVADPPRPPALSSWGRGGTGEVWCNPKNAWIYPELARAEQAFAEAMLTGADEADHDGVMNQALRELMLAESSDWPFVLDAESAVDYAHERVWAHLSRFSDLVQMATGIRAGDDAKLLEIQREDAIFPALHWQAYRPRLGPVAHAPGRVLMLSWEYPPHVVGGLGQHVYDLSRYLVKRGHPVTVLTVLGPGSQAPAREWMNGVDVVRVSIAEPSGDNFWDWVLAMNLALYQTQMAMPRPAVLHAHDWLVADAAMVLKESLGIPLLSTIHATERGRQGGIYTPLQAQIDEQERRLADASNRVIVCSRAMKTEIVRQWKTPSPKVVVIPNGVDPTRVHPGRGLPRGYQAGVPWLLFFGRLVPEKGIDVLVEALPQVQKHVPGVRLAVLGSGPYRRELEAQVKALQLSEVVYFGGFARQRQRNLWLEYADLAVFPSRYEPFGIAALEAMAAGVPVVASKVGGMADFVISDRNGVAVPPGDPAALAEAIVNVLTDAKRAKSLVTQALVDVRHYGWDQIARRTAHTYQRLIRVSQR